MKNQIFTFLIVCITICLYGQSPDGQWYVKQYEYLSAANTFGNTSTLGNRQSFYIHNVDSPNTNITDTDGNPVEARNDIFAIFDNGEYFNSHNMPAWDGQTYTDGVHYNFPNPVKYMYYTNVYEEDEPDPYIVNTSGTPSISPGYTTPNKYLTANHTLVRGKDVTLIINTERIRECDSASVSYDLCFDDIVSSTTLSPPAIDISPVFGDGTTFTYINGGVEGTKNGNCIRGITLDFTKPFSFVNLKMPDVMNPDLRDNVLRFTLTPKVGSCGLDVLDLIIMDTHDPNFVRVNCVENRGKQNYVHYRVQCTNDGKSPVNGDLTFDLGLPVDVHPDMDLRITDCFINSTDPTYNCPKERTYSSTGSISAIHDRFEVKFISPPGLGVNMTAWFDICVRLKNDIDVETIDLHLSDPTTDFDNQLWAIHHFYDLCDKVERYDIDKYELYYELNASSKRKCKRSKGKCECLEKITSNPPLICLFKIGKFCVRWLHIGILLGVLLLVFIGIRKGKRS